LNIVCDIIYKLLAPETRDSLAYTHTRECPIKIQCVSIWITCVKLETIILLWTTVIFSKIPNAQHKACALTQIWLLSSLLNPMNQFSDMFEIQVRGGRLETMNIYSPQQKLCKGAWELLISSFIVINTITRCKEITLICVPSL
jgi:hypothetical protein